VNSKVTLHFDVQSSRILTEEERNTIAEKLGARMTREGVLMLSSQESRSQMANREDVLAKFDKVIAGAFAKKKVRKPTRRSKSAVEQRIKKKKVVSEKKKWRKKPDL
jgi:ribosome-associated protein